MRPSRPTLAALVLPVLLVGCGDDSNAEATGDATAGTETGGIATVMVSGNLTDFVTSTGVQDVEVCVRDFPELACGMSDTAGDYVVEVPADEEIILVFDRDLYAPTLMHNLFTEDSTLDLGVATDDTLLLLVTQAGETIDPMRGHVAVTAAEGSVITIAPDSGTIVYFDVDNIPDPSLTAMGSIGLAGIANVQPGPLEVTVTHPMLTCTTQGWPGAAANSYRLTVEAESISGSYGSVCE